MTIPDVRQKVVVQIPAWNTLYQIRDFGYHVTGLHASDAAGKPLRVSRSDKQTWTIQGQGEIRVEYADYWDEPGPFGTQLNGEHAFLNLAMVLCYVPDRRAEESVVHFSDVPQSWRIAVELPAAEGAVGAIARANYDALVDAPVEVGPLGHVSVSGRRTADPGGDSRGRGGPRAPDGHALAHRGVRNASDGRTRPSANTCSSTTLAATSAAEAWNTPTAPRSRVGSASSTGQRQRARILSPVECQAHSSAVARAGGLYA